MENSIKVSLQSKKIKTTTKYAFVALYTDL